MGIQLGVDCVKCKAMAPNVGDGGYLGAPLLEVKEEVEAADETMPSFGYFFEALEGIGIRPYDLVVLRDFLIEHKGHKVQISDGNYIPSKKILAAGSAQRAEKAKRTESGEFRERVYEISCGKCGESLAAPAPELLQTAEPLSPSAEAVANFLKRWKRAPDDGWNHGLMGIVDPHDDFMEELQDFLESHQRHELLVTLKDA